MNIILNRIKLFSDCTIGEMFINNNFFCNTLEDVVREIKIPQKTAIPQGEYIIIIDYSSRFKREMPRVLKKDGKDPDGFSGIRIHTGNYPKDTEGCILVGEWDKKNNYIINSKKTFDKFFNIIKEYLNKEKFIPFNIFNKFKGGI